MRQTLAGVLFLVTAPSVSAQETERADLVFHNGIVWTVVFTRE